MQTVWGYCHVIAWLLFLINVTYISKHFFPPTFHMSAAIKMHYLELSGKKIKIIIIFSSLWSSNARRKSQTLQYVLNVQLYP